MIVIKICTDYTTTPGARYLEDGPFSGQDFREKHLERAWRSGDTIEIWLDGTEGYATSFLEEAFGGLARQHMDAPLDEVQRRLKFISHEEPQLEENIREYIAESRNRPQNKRR